MKRIWFFLLVICCFPLPVFAQAETTENTAQLRVLHYGEGVPAVDVLVDDELVLRDLNYEAVSRWLVLPTDAKNLTIMPAGQDAEPLFSVDLTLETDQWLSLLLIGNTADNSLTTHLLTHEVNNLSPDMARLSFFNAQAQPIRIEVNGTTTAENMGVGETPWGTDEPAGNYPAQIFIGDALVADIGTLPPFEALTSYLILLRSKEGQIQTDIIPFKLHSYVYLAHFDPTTPETVDLYVNGQIQLANTAYANMSSQLLLPAGQYDLAVVPTGTALDKAVYSEQTSFQPDSNNIITLVDNKTFVLKLQTNALTEANRALAEGKNAEIWLYNGLNSSIDVRSTEGITLLEGLANNGEIARLDFPADTYNLQISTHDAQVLFDLPGLVLRGGNVYLLALLGTTEGARTTHLSAYCVRAEGC